MTAKKLIVLSTALAALLSGCAITPDDATWVPANRIFANATHKDGNAALLVVRFPALNAKPCTFTFLMDDQRLLRIETKEKAVLSIPPGKHKFQITWDWDGRGLCHRSKDDALQAGQIRYLIVEPGRTYRYNFSHNGYAFRFETDQTGYPTTDADKNLFHEQKTAPMKP